jgi:hypothetical protein
MQEDPFVKQGLADARVIEFRASQRAGDISNGSMRPERVRRVREVRNVRWVLGT